jgi:serine/threonine protein kinase
MGNIKFKEIENSKSGYEKENYEYLNSRKLKDFCEMKLFREPYSKRHYILLTTEYMIQNKELTESEISKLKELNNLENSTRLINHKFLKESLFCIENIKINFFFEVEKINFIQLAEKWNRKKELVSENKIWILLGDVVNYLTDLKNLGFSHGDIKPDNLYLSSNKVVKVFSPLLFTKIENGYKLMMLNENYKTPLSPELMYFYHNRERFPSCNKEKNDIFCMALSILCLLTNDDFRFYFDFCEGIVFCERILGRLAEICEKFQFTENFHFFMKRCLDENETKRANLLELYELLNQFRLSGSITPWEF